MKKNINEFIKNKFFAIISQIFLLNKQKVQDFTATKENN